MYVSEDEGRIIKAMLTLMGRQVNYWDDKPGLGQAIAEAISGERVNMAFFVAQAIGRKFSAVLGFETESDAKTAAPLIKKAAASKRKAR